jgi:hypothetical protein
VEAVFGIAAGAIALVAIVPYVRDILRGSTIPQRFSWLVWCVLSIVVFASQRADGASWSLVLVAAHVLMTVAVLLFAVRRGMGGGTPLDWALLGVAGAGVVGWQLADDPTIATGCAVLADAAAVAMMLPKTYRNPYTETLSSYVLGAVSSLCAVAAVGTLDVALLAYPVYLAVTGSLLSLVIAGRRRQLRSHDLLTAVPGR